MAQSFLLLSHECAVVTIRTAHLFPSITDVAGVLEFKPLRANTGKLCALPLPNDRVAGVAVVSNQLAGVAHMFAVVAAEAPGKIVCPMLFG